MRVALQLRELARDAPGSSAWTSAGRFASQFAQGASDQIEGTASMVGDVWGSVPLVGTAQERAAARRRFWEDAKALAQPWLAIEDALSRLADGKYGYLGGSLSAAMVLRTRGARGKIVAKYGAHDALPLDVLWGLKRGGYGDGDLASIRKWVETRAQKHFVSELLRLEQVPLPSLEEMIASGHVDLMLQEAHGGHTLLRHIGRDIDFLRMRQDTEPGRRGPISKSSFLDIDEAERVVTDAVGDGQGEIRTWLRGDQPELELHVELRTPAGLLVAPRGWLSDATEAIVRIVRVGDGSMRVVSAYVSGAA